MLKDEEKLEQDKTEDVKASSSLVSDTESTDKHLVEKDIKEDETSDESQAAQTDNSEAITDKDNTETSENLNTQSADGKVSEHQIKETVTETSISYKDAVSDDSENTEELEEFAKNIKQSSELTTVSKKKSDEDASLESEEKTFETEFEEYNHLAPLDPQRLVKYAALKLNGLNCKVSDFKSDKSINNDYEFKLIIKANFSINENIRELPGIQPTGEYCHASVKDYVDFRKRLRRLISSDEKAMESFVDRYAAQEPNRAVDKRDETYLYYPAQETSYSHPCDTCGGTGDVPCGNCSGSGKVECRRCNGSGFLNEVTTYSDGSKKTRKVMCSSCWGRGYHKCKVCKGTGLLTCSNCQGTAITTEVSEITGIAKFKSYYNLKFLDDLGGYQEIFSKTEKALCGYPNEFLKDNFEFSLESVVKNDLSGDSPLSDGNPYIVYKNTGTGIIEDISVSGKTYTMVGLGNPTVPILRPAIVDDLLAKDLKDIENFKQKGKLSYKTVKRKFKQYSKNKALKQVMDSVADQSATAELSGSEYRKKLEYGCFGGFISYERLCDYENYLRYIAKNLGPKQTRLIWYVATILVSIYSAVYFEDKWERSFADHPFLVPFETVMWCIIGIFLVGFCLKVASGIVTWVRRRFISKLYRKNSKVDEQTPLGFFIIIVFFVTVIGSLYGFLTKYDFLPKGEGKVIASCNYVIDEGKSYANSAAVFATTKVYGWLGKELPDFAKPKVENKQPSTATKSSKNAKKRQKQSSKRSKNVEQQKK
ncbi:MAG: hypothetical protein MR983_03225 [Succinatimonas sp.]|nr:hypothetical protein [Succinatimonas sp.]